MGVKCLAQEHNAVLRPGLEPGTSDPESSALTIRPPRLPRKTLIYTLMGPDLVILSVILLASKTRNADNFRDYLSSLSKEHNP